ncbi:DUF1700 domain-containing protein [Promicromonospora thailandica]|nr:DUF1700 domain-containing protein [Promicromonospora thailandica]
MNADTEDTYLRDVAKRLRALTPAQRSAVLDDVRAHFADAAEAGRTPEQAVEGLGDPATFTRRVQAELGHDADRAGRIRRVLQWTAVAMAVFTAMFETFLWPDGMTFGLFLPIQGDGFAVVLWSLVPALVAALPLVVPARARTATTVVVLAALTALALAAQMTFVPTAMLAWAALIVPVIARHGRPAPAWRIAGGVLLMLPSAQLLSGALAGSWGMDAEAMIYTAVPVGLGLLLLVGRSWPGVVVAAFGAGVLVWGTLDLGMLFLLLWWAGGLFLTVGLSHALAHANLRRTGRA